MALKLEEHQVSAPRFQIVRMAIERQTSISSDHPAVTEFWEAFNYLQLLSENSVVDHSSDPSMIAINLNALSEHSAVHKQKLVDGVAPRDLLRATD